MSQDAQMEKKDILFKLEDLSNELDGQILEHAQLRATNEGQAAQLARADGWPLPPLLTPVYCIAVPYNFRYPH